MIEVSSAGDLPSAEVTILPYGRLTHAILYAGYTKRIRWGILGRLTELGMFFWPIAMIPKSMIRRYARRRFSGSVLSGVMESRSGRMTGDTVSAVPEYHYYYG
jgi:hypothetical protein